MSKIRVSAPGKVILHGEHSVVYDKLAVAASLGLRTRLEYCEEGAGLRVEFGDLGLTQCYNFKDVHQLLSTQIPLTQPTAYYNLTHPELLDHDKITEIVEKFVDLNRHEPKQRQALVSFFYLFFAIVGSTDSNLSDGFKLAVRSDLTVGAGTGSSASFAVAIAAFLLHFVKVKKFKSKNLYKSLDLNVDNLQNFDTTELDLVSKWAFQSERIIHGTPSGVDNTICTFGGLVSFRKGTRPQKITLSSKITLILIDTNTPRDTKTLVGKVATKRAKYRPIIDAILDAMDHTTISALDYFQKMETSDVSGETYDALGELADLNQNLLRCLGVSHPKLDQACEILATFGLHCKLTGAGGGGCAICVVPPSVKGVEKAITELKLNGFGAVLTDLGGCGVRVD
ncbi:mevalonate kinase [Tribolium castaneum]|uniref:Mevalonate kinase n=1 Tax=Tribolium castaneum TaxID=7070 RepID=D2A4R0_TRICA|nr:PREDICTED: mevalonate kinase [Tribolium castaneum]EFA05256.2 Mevalonate kinase-like Protein [Tribolium castaneum]|eukprot:XP_972334.2 PREDICTED: mevalonate kinase [Tribolium castaneum]